MSPRRESPAALGREVEDSMLTGLTTNNTMHLLKETIRFAERRQEVLAGNVANIDTPGYRMRDLPVAKFQQALKAAVARQERQSQSVSLGEIAFGLKSPIAPETVQLPAEDLFPDELFQVREIPSQPVPTFHDGGNRSVENQFLQITKNAALQNFAVEVLTMQYSQIAAAISERV